ncbi:hypothetical protein K6966_00350 [Enterobacter cloacae complex sp.]|nr:hypothetical protein K6966_00350 [Enterobacter cloacae complex sp.]
MGEISVKTGNNARNGGKNSLNRLIRCVCGKKIGPDPRNFNQRVSLGRNDLLIRTFLSERMFIAEFDFSDFFGTIEHRFLFEQFNLNGFYISQEEKYIIKAFLAERSVGIPQGTSISLFLANLCCWNFDQALGKVRISHQTQKNAYVSD